MSTRTTIATFIATALVVSGCSAGSTPWDEHGEAAFFARWEEHGGKLAFYAMEPDHRFISGAVADSYNRHYGRWIAPEDCQFAVQFTEDNTTSERAATRLDDWASASNHHGAALASAQWHRQNC